MQAGKALLAVEQQVLLDAATAYMNVIRDRNVLQLRQTNVRVLTEQLKASQARFEVGEITRTDVAQSRARLALSRSQLSGAEANLAQSVAIIFALSAISPRRFVFRLCQIARQNHWMQL